MKLLAQGIPSRYDKEPKLSIPSGEEGISAIVNMGINLTIALGVAISVFFIMYSGWLFIKAEGDPGEVKKAKSALTATVIGIAIIATAYLIRLIVANTLFPGLINEIS